MSNDYDKGFTSGFDLGFEKGVAEGRRRAELERGLTIDFGSWQESWNKYTIKKCTVCDDHTEGYVCTRIDCPSLSNEKLLKAGKMPYEYYNIK